MAELSRERIEIIKNNIDNFLAGKITMDEIATLINTSNRGTVSRNIRKLLSSESDKLQEFEKLTDLKTGRRERYLKLYTERIKENFDQIISRKMTKRALAKELGINEMTLGSLIEEIYKSEPDKIEEYKKVKALNSRTGGKYIRKHQEKNDRRKSLQEDNRSISRLEYMRLSREDQIDWIMYKTNKRRLKGPDANIMTESQVRQTIERTIQYFLNNRNNLFRGQKSNFDEADIFIMLFENPGLLCLGEDKKERVFSFLDNEEDIGIEAANQITRKYPGILAANLGKTMSQVRIARDLGILDKFILNPKAFITAPKTTYALAMHARNKAGSEEEFQELSISSIYVGRIPLLRNYGYTYEELYEKYPLPDKYVITDEEIAKKDFRKRLKVNVDQNTFKRENNEVVKEGIERE